MRGINLKHYICPATGCSLRTQGSYSDTDTIVSDELIGGKDKNGNPRRYPVKDGIVYFSEDVRESLSAVEQAEYDYYQTFSGDYDSYQDWLFKSFYVDEEDLRREMIDALEIDDNSLVLEIGCGTCRDSVEIARRLGPGGTLFLQDLSSEMLLVGREKISELVKDDTGPTVEFSVGNAHHLPFADNHIDAVFHFGGINLFSDVRQAIAEMARVVRPGGKVVLGDEGIAPWLRNKQYGEILINSSQHYGFEPPIAALPPTAKDVRLRWIIGNAFYLIEFTVSESEPEVDLDLPILGLRGGTHRSRYFGQLEGVTPRTKKAVIQAAINEGISVHEWLEKSLNKQLETEREDSK